MKKNQHKALKEKLLVAIKKVLKDNSVEQTNKIEKILPSLLKILQRGLI